MRFLEVVVALAIREHRRPKLRFLVIIAMTRLGNVQSFKTYVLHF